MTRAREDRLFERYCRTGNVRALAAVFDRTAPVLWRLAARISSDRHSAEDALQNAFLVAIEEAATWDQDRPLLPWLLGILTNQVRLARRSTARRIDAERVAEEPLLDPSVVAEVRELRDALRQALDSVPVAYRKTLELHLLDGSSPNEIALTTGLRAGTVRMQLHRGIAFLRDKLPDGLIATTVLGAMTASASAAIRRQVLSKAAERTVLKSVGLHVSLAGMIAMKKTLVSIAAVLSLFTFVGYAWHDHAADSSPAKSPNSAPLKVTVGDGGSLHADTDVADSSSDVEPERLPLANPGQQGHITLRVVAGESDAPVPYLGLRVVCSDRKIRYYNTGADGAVGFLGPAGKARADFMTFTGTDRETEGFSITAGVRSDYIIRLPSRLRISIRVSNAQGLPVPDATVIGQIETDRNLGYHSIGHTDSEGRLVYESALRSLPVRAMAEGRIRSSSKFADARDGRDHQFELVIGGPAQTVLGTVFDLSKRPVEGFLVAVYSASSGANQLPFLTRTDSGGRFQVTQVPPGPCQVIAMAGLGKYGVVELGKERRFGRAKGSVPRSGQLQIDVHLVKGAKVAGVVRGVLDEDSSSSGHASVLFDEPLWGIAQELYWSVRLESNQAYALEGILPGTYRLKHGRLNGPVVTLGDEQEYHWDIDVPEVHRLSLLLLDPQGAPLQKWRVIYDPEGNRRYHETDREGRVSFRTRSVDACEIAVSAPGRGPRVHSVTVAPSKTEHTLRIPELKMPTAIVKGQITGDDINWSRLKIFLRRTGQSNGDHRILVSEVDPLTGDFVSGLLMPGRYAIEVQSGQQFGKAEARRVDRGSTVDYGSIEMIKPGTLLVVATDARGERIPYARIYLAPSGQDGLGGSPPSSTSARGVEIKGIPADVTFDLHVWSRTTIPESRLGMRLTNGEDLEVMVSCRPGTACVFSLPRSLPKSLPSKGADDDVHKLLRLIVRDANRSVVMMRVFQEKEPDVRHGLAPGIYELEIVEGRESIKQELVVPRSSTTVSFELTTPSRKK